MFQDRLPPRPGIAEASTSRKGRSRHWWLAAAGNEAVGRGSALGAALASTRVLDLVSTAAIIAAAVVIIWNRLGAGGGTVPPPPETPPETIDLDGAAFLGSDRARIGILMYSDFQCPFCRSFAQETLPLIDKAYLQPGTVRLAFKHFPLPNHPHARQAAESAECAGKQGRFWPMHDLLFSDQEHLDQGRLMGRAQRLNLNVSLFADCLAGQTAAKVMSDAASARALRLTGTPAFLLGTFAADGTLHVVQTLSGAAPISAFSKVINDVLRRIDEDDKGNRTGG